MPVIFIFVYKCFFLRMFIHVCVYIFFLCISVYAFRYVCLFVWIHERVSIMCLCMSICLFVWVRTFGVFSVYMLVGEWFGDGSVSVSSLVRATHHPITAPLATPLPAILTSMRRDKSSAILGFGKPFTSLTSSCVWKGGSKSDRWKILARYTLYLPLPPPPSLPLPLPPKKNIKRGERKSECISPHILDLFHYYYFI